MCPCMAPQANRRVGSDQFSWFSAIDENPQKCWIPNENFWNHSNIEFLPCPKKFGTLKKVYCVDPQKILDLKKLGFATFAPKKIFGPIGP